MNYKSKRRTIWIIKNIEQLVLKTKDIIDQTSMVIDPKAPNDYVTNIDLSISTYLKNELKNSLIEFGAGSTKKEYTEQNFGLVKEIFRQCVDIRQICSSALDLCYIAAGRIDGYFEIELKPWDIAAGSLILQEAGGKITDYNILPVQFAKPTSVIASNGTVHSSLYQIISQRKEI